MVLIIDFTVMKLTKWPGKHKMIDRMRIGHGLLVLGSKDTRDKPLNLISKGRADLD